MSNSIALAQCLISVGILAFLWCGPVARLRRDNFRSKIRRIRDDLFDFMYKNGYDFKNPAYQATRQMLNGLIRTSNYLSVFTFMHALIIVVSGKRRNPLSAIHAIEKLPPGDLKEKMNQATQQAMKEMLRFIFTQKISGLLTIALLKTFYCLYVICTWRKKNGSHVEKDGFVERPANHLLDDAYVLGSPTPPSGAGVLLVG